MSHSILPGAHDFGIYDSQFIDNSQTINASTVVNINSQTDGASGLRILLNHSIPEALHDSCARDVPPRCHPGTCFDYIDKITNWSLNDSGRNRRIIWVYGPAGVGKSAVAQSCAEAFAQKGKLGAAFFFSRSNKRDNPNRFFTTISYQLATRDKNYQRAIDTMVHDDPTLVTKSIKQQFRDLIVTPLNKLRARGHDVDDLVIIVDGLDECASVSAQCDIVEIVAASIELRTTPFLWVFFSRSEAYIKATFTSSQVSPLSFHIELPVSREKDHEIAKFLTDELKEIQRKRNLPASWPSERDVRTLVNLSAGLFNYASTVIRFIGDDDSLGPDDQLRVVLALAEHPNEKNETHPLSELDSFYLLIMRHIPQRLLPTVQKILLVTTLYDGDNAATNANMIGLSEAQFQNACRALASVVRLSDGTIHFYHSSFMEFLLDLTRSGDLCLRSSSAVTLRRDLLERLNKVHINSSSPDPTSILVTWATGLHGPYVYRCMLGAFFALCQSIALDSETLTGLIKFSYMMIPRLCNAGHVFLRRDEFSVDDFLRNIPESAQGQIISNYPQVLFHAILLTKPERAEWSRPYVLGHGGSRALLWRDKYNGTYICPYAGPPASSIAKFAEGKIIESHPINSLIINKFESQTVNPRSTENAQVTHNGGAKGLRTLFLNSIPEALHDSTARGVPPRCHPGTRSSYINLLVRWVLNSRERNHRIVWMHGSSGVGKSAVAQSCAEAFAEKGKLGATFFFSRSDKRDNPNRIFTTISYQLAMKDKNYRQIIDTMIHNDPALVTKPIGRQFRDLIVTPLNKLQTQGHDVGELAIIVDGLDQCAGSRAQCDIVEIVAASVQDRTTPFLWVFFSRPEAHLKVAFTSPQVSPLTLRIELPISRETDHEIIKFLTDGLGTIREKFSLPASWPSEEDIWMLVDLSAGLFNYASTLLRFIGDSNPLGPENQLRTLLALAENSVGTHVPDHFYTFIMRSVPEDVLPTVQRVLLVTTFYDGADVVTNANVTGLSKAQFQDACRTLPLLLQFHCGAVRTPYASFMEFLQDPARSGRFCIKSASAVALRRDLLKRLNKVHADSSSLGSFSMPLTWAAGLRGFHVYRCMLGAFFTLCQSIPLDSETLTGLTEFSYMMIPSLWDVDHTFVFSPGELNIDEFMQNIPENFRGKIIQRYPRILFRVALHAEPEYAICGRPYILGHGNNRSLLWKDSENGGLYIRPYFGSRLAVTSMTKTAVRKIVGVHKGGHSVLTEASSCPSGAVLETGQPKS